MIVSSPGLDESAGLAVAAGLEVTTGEMAGDGVSAAEASTAPVGDAIGADGEADEGVFPPIVSGDVDDGVFPPQPARSSVTSAAAKIFATTPTPSDECVDSIPVCHFAVAAPTLANPIGTASGVHPGNP